MRMANVGRPILAAARFSGRSGPECASARRLKPAAGKNARPTMMRRNRGILERGAGGKMTFEWLDPCDVDRLAEWDCFLSHSPRGHFCQLSTWLQSFRSYRFSFTVLTAREKADGPLIGGAGLLQFGNRIFGCLSGPIAPIVETGFEDCAPGILEQILRRAECANVALAQFLPACADVDVPWLLPQIAFPEGYPSYEGEPLGSAPSEMLLVDLPQSIDDEEWRETMLLRFRQQTRRHIRTAERSGLELGECRTSEELREAYQIIETSGRLRGYPTRKWEDFGETLLQQVQRGQAVVLKAMRGNQVLGAHYGGLAGTEVHRHDGRNPACRGRGGRRLLSPLDGN